MAVLNHPQKLLAFGSYRLDLASLELTCNGHHVRLAAQPARVLAYLASRPGEVVARESLRREIWSEGTFVDFEHALNNCIKQTRAALGDDASSPQYIETLPKRGYRFIGKVETIEELPPEGIASQYQPSASGSAAASPTRRRALRIGLSFVGAVGGIIVWLWLHPAPSPRASGVRQLTHDGHAEFTSEIVTDGARLYFMEREGGKWYLAQVSVNGGEPAQIPTPFPNNMLFDISADGSRLLVGSFEGDEKQLPLWSVSLPQGVPRRLGDVRAQGAAWSPDGRSLMFANKNDIYLATADGSSPRKIATASRPPEFLRWSPDGNVVRFMQGDAKAGALTLWEVNLDGSGLRTFTPEGNRAAPGWLMGECNGGWTSDGKYYFYRSERGNGGEIKVIREKRSLASELFGLPSLLSGSKDSAKLVYARDSSGFCGLLPGRDDQHIYFISMWETRELVRYNAKLKQYDPFVSGIPVRWAEVSPDGRRIAYISTADVQLWVSALDGSSKTQLTFPPESAVTPAWSPDGSKIAYETWAAGQISGIAVVPATGGERQILIHSGKYADEGPRWTPSGDAVLFERFEQGNARVGTYSVDLRTGSVSEADVPRNLMWMRWAPNGRYAFAVSPDNSAKEESRVNLYLYEAANRKWTKVPSATAAFMNIGGWSADSKYIYFQDMYGGEKQPVFRARVADRTVERVTATDLTVPVDVAGYTLIAITPDGAPIASAIRRQSDVFSLSFGVQ